MCPHLGSDLRIGSHHRRILGSIGTFPSLLTLVEVGDPIPEDTQLWYPPGPPADHPPGLCGRASTRKAPRLRDARGSRMTVTETGVALLLAGLALYGLGVPLAWLLPAPAESQWVHRIAIGPLYAIALATVGAWLLGNLGVQLHPLQLVGLMAAAWAVAWWRTGAQWRLRQSLTGAIGPASMVGMAAVVWFLSLVGYGLYLPNRDFKNHAYFVAQVAFTKSADSAQVFRASPLSEPNDTSFYPFGTPHPAWLGSAHRRFALRRDHGCVSRTRHLVVDAFGVGGPCAAVGSSLTSTVGHRR